MAPQKIKTRKKGTSAVAAAATVAHSHLFRQASRPPLARLLEGVREHLGKETGMTNDLLERLSYMMMGGGEGGCGFAGVFSADKIPPSLSARHAFCCIVNLDPWHSDDNDGVGGGGGDDGETSGEKKNEGHFVCIFAISDTVLYVDSYGGKPKQEHVLRFLRLCNREAMYNKRQVQDYGSSYCGLFALFFLLFLAKRPRLAINFFSQKKRLRNNDRLCLRYLLQMV
jgi:hypothetical protein